MSTDLSGRYGFEPSFILKRSQMQGSLVMTVIGADRPGLVDSLAGIVEEHGGNWLESRMSRLGGQFAGILRVQVRAEKQAALVQALKELERDGLAVVIHPDRYQPAHSTGALVLLEIVGQDRPGIVHQISHALASHSVNVEELHTECGSAAMSGETLFRAQARLNLPESCDLARLRTELEEIAEDLIVDLTLKMLSPEQLAAGSAGSTPGQTV